MNKLNTLILMILASFSTTGFSAGEHSGGHDHQANGTEFGQWMAPPSEAVKPNPVKASRESIAKGENLYQQNCISCHGTNADGNSIAGTMLSPKPANLRVMSGTHPDGDFAYKIKVGRGAMPAWETILDDTEIWHLVNYIQALNSRPVANPKGADSH